MARIDSLKYNNFEVCHSSLGPSEVTHLVSAEQMKSITRWERTQLQPKVSGKDFTQQSLLTAVKGKRCFLIVNCHLQTYCF